MKSSTCNRKEKYFHVSGLRGYSKKCETFTLEGGSSYVVDSTVVVVVGCGSPVAVDSAVVVVEVVVVLVTS